MEDTLNTFEGWLQYQGLDAPSLTSEQLETYHSAFDKFCTGAAVKQPVGLMKLGHPGDHLYAVAIREGTDLWLTLWVRCSLKGEVFVCYPRSDRKWAAHTSYHRNGRLHMKSYKHPPAIQKDLQPLTGAIKGTVTLGLYMGHGGKGIGAICDPAAFTGIVKVPAGILDGRKGAVAIDLLEPVVEPRPPFQDIFTREYFREVEPHLVITVLQ